MRRATEQIRVFFFKSGYFNPRSPWGERLNIYRYSKCANTISIHALREESDLHLRFLVLRVTVFQSTLSVRRATFRWYSSHKRRISISIHALREESDRLHIRSRSISCHFNPRSPWGERPITPFMVLNPVPKPISIHALREESDHMRSNHLEHGGRFQSTLSVRRATLFK